ncbi:MAG: hypothetical protein ABH834_06585 [Candidatus Altiarchaeota archaeon]
MECIRCGREKAVVALAYNGESLGPNCFTEVFERRVRKTIRKKKMLAFDDTTAVALTGRASSSVLAYLLKNFSSKRVKSRVFALTVDDGVADVSSAGKLCEKLSIQHHVVSKRKSPKKEALRLGASKVAFGTNLDDEARETLKGFLEGNMINSGKKEDTACIKPLRECPSEEIRLYAKIKKIPHAKTKDVKDEVAEILDKLEKKHPGARFQILASKDCLNSL